MDMDRSVSPTHGDREGTAWNGHFGCKCHHPLFVFNQSGDLERCALRKGNVHSADGWKEVLASFIARYKGRDLMRFFRADAAFALPKLYEMLEAEGYFHTIRLKGNNVLQEIADWSLTSIQSRRVKIGARGVRHARAIPFQLAEVAVPRNIFGKILAAIRPLKPPPRPA